MSPFSELRKLCQIPRWSLNDGKYGFLSEKNTVSSQSSQQRQKSSVAARASKENLIISLFGPNFGTGLHFHSVSIRKLHSFSLAGTVWAVCLSCHPCRPNWINFNCNFCNYDLLTRNMSKKHEAKICKYWTYISRAYRKILLALKARKLVFPFSSNTCHCLFSCLHWQTLWWFGSTE